MTAEERETTINYDHYTGKVTVFTTQEHVFDHFQKRLGKTNPDVTYSNDEKNDCYTIQAPEKVFRKPYYVSPVIRNK